MAISGNRPIVPEGSAPVHDAQDLSLGPEGAAMRILLVDDDEAFRATLWRLLA